MADAISTFKNKQSLFTGEKIIYKEKKPEWANPANNVNKPVNSTVREWLNYSTDLAKTHLKAKLDQESTNCSGQAKADLIIDGVNYGELTTGELMALKGFFEQQVLKDMIEAMPTQSLEEKWVKSNSSEYADRDIFESDLQSWVDKVVDKIDKVEFDPQGKQPGVVIKIGTTIEKADVTKQKFTGCISHIQRANVMAKHSKIILGVKEALEKANHTEVVESKAKVNDLITYLFKY